MVLVEDAAGSVASSDVEAVESAWFGDWLGSGRSGAAAWSAMRPVRVVERLVLSPAATVEVGQGKVRSYGMGETLPAPAPTLSAQQGGPISS